MIKGPDYVINAFSEKIKGDKYRLLIMGVDKVPTLFGMRHKIKCFLMKFGYDYSYKQMIDNINTDKRIKCIPACYEIVDYIKQSSCYLSYFRIPHANLSLAENLLLQNPCIAADNEEAREYTNNGEYAMLVEPNNIDAFSKCLKEFFLNIEKWKGKAIEASIFIENKFEKKKNVSKLNAVLETLL